MASLTGIELRTREEGLTDSVLGKNSFPKKKAAPKPSPIATTKRSQNRLFRLDTSLKPIYTDPIFIGLATS